MRHAVDFVGTVQVDWRVVGHVGIGRVDLSHHDARVLQFDLRPGAKTRIEQGAAVDAVHALRWHANQPGVGRQQKRFVRQNAAHWHDIHLSHVDGPFRAGRNGKIVHVVAHRPEQGLAAHGLVLVELASIAGVYPFGLHALLQLFGLVGVRPPGGHAHIDRGIHISNVAINRGDFQKSVCLRLASAPDLNCRAAKNQPGIAFMAGLQNNRRSLAPDALGGIVGHVVDRDNSMPRLSDQGLFYVKPYPQLGHVQPLTVILANQ